MNQRMSANQYKVHLDHIFTVLYFLIDNFQILSTLTMLKASSRDSGARKSVHLVIYINSKNSKISGYPLKLIKVP